MKRFYVWLEGNSVAWSLLFTTAMIVALFFSMGSGLLLKLAIVLLLGAEPQIGSLGYFIISMIAGLTYFGTMALIGIPFVRGVMTSNWRLGRFDQWEAKA